MDVVGYVNTFIAVAEDCRAATGEIPPERVGGPTVASTQYAMLAAAPGRWTQEEVLLASSPQVRGHDVSDTVLSRLRRSTSPVRAHAYAPPRCRIRSVGDCTTTPTAGSRFMRSTPRSTPSSAATRR